MGTLLFPELSYQIVGVLFTVYNNLGYGYQEKYYQRALTREFENAHLRYKRERKVIIKYRDRIIGRYFIDFVIENSVVLEIKVCNQFFDRDIKQVLAYLKSTGLRLGILCIFTKQGIQFKRLAN